MPKALPATVLRSWRLPVEARSTIPPWPLPATVARPTMVPSLKLTLMPLPALSTAATRSSSTSTARSTANPSRLPVAVIRSTVLAVVSNTTTPMAKSVTVPRRMRHVVVAAGVLDAEPVAGPVDGVAGQVDGDARRPDDQTVARAVDEVSLEAHIRRHGGAAAHAGVGRGCPGVARDDGEAGEDWCRQRQPAPGSGGHGGHAVKVLIHAGDRG